MDYNLNEIIGKYRDKMFTLAYKISGHREDAEDIVQDSLIKIHSSIDNFRGESHIYTWIYRIVLNTALKHKKRLQAVINESFNDEIYRDNFNRDDFLPELSDQERRLILDDFIYEVRDKCHFFTMQRLTEEQRVVFILAEVIELSMKDIGEIINISEGVVKSRLFRARKKLKEHITGKCYWYNPDNQCRCESKALYVLKKYPQVLSQLKNKRISPEFHKVIKKSLEKSDYTIEEIFRM